MKTGEDIWRDLTVYNHAHPVEHEQLRNKRYVDEEDYIKLQTEVRNWRILVNQNPDKPFDDMVLRK